MNNPSSQTLSTLIWRSVLQAMSLAVLLGFILSVVYGLVHHYQEKHRHIEQLAALLTNTASTADDATLVAKQVSILLDSEPSIQSILFYSTTQPIINSDQSSSNQINNDWKNALFASTVSFDYPVISPDIASISNLPTDASPARSSRLDKLTPPDEQLTNRLDNDAINENSTLIGYINITLDVDELRLNWFRSNLLLWLITIALGIIWMLFILGKLNRPIKEVTALSKICDTIIEDTDLRQLPAMEQRSRLQELTRIEQAFMSLFNRLQDAKQEYESLAVYEQQLHNKSVSLDVQHHSFQNMMTHELKTSLNAIVGGLQLLEPQALNTEQKDAVDIIHKGSQQLVLMLEQIIQLNQIEKGQISVHLGEFNPLQLIADLLVKYEPIAKQKGLTLISNIHHIDYILESDAEKIQQILSILLSNAIKFTPSGTITITSQLTHFNKSNRWQISIKDTGIGISANHINDIFNPFFQVDSSQTREYEGTGIGLPVVKQLTQLMGAAVEVDSTPNVGSQFIVTIPVPNKTHSRQNVLAGMVIVYYYHHDAGSLGYELEHLGATVISHQQEPQVIDEMSTKKINIVMFAEDVSPSKAERLTRRIRHHETDHRALLIYWYPHYQLQYLDNFEHGLKAAGIDYCHSSIDDEDALDKLLKNWLAWT